jgi:hypothetical protein
MPTSQPHPPLTDRPRPAGSHRSLPIPTSQPYTDQAMTTRQFRSTQAIPTRHSQPGSILARPDKPCRFSPLRTIPTLRLPFPGPTHHSSLRLPKPLPVHPDNPVQTLSDTPLPYQPPPTMRPRPGPTDQAGSPLPMPHHPPTVHVTSDPATPDKPIHSHPALPTTTCHVKPARSDGPPRA